ncbi:MAG: hypothetical protein Q8R67_27035 [Rhodoferax sp.]|nr:hypothetical protein [Rhodoferax sp.]MDP3655330.1 hypothetical protein [Rhodoferax sp.]
MNTAVGAPAGVATANGAAEGTPDPPAQGRGGSGMGTNSNPAHIPLFRFSAFPLQKNISLNQKMSKMDINSLVQ